MKNAKFLLTLFLFALIISAISVAVAFEFRKEAINDVVTVEDTKIPALYNLTIKNSNIYDDYFQVYTLLEAKLLPLGSFLVRAGEEKIVTVSLLPFDILKERCGKGTCTIQYYIKGEKSGAVEDSLAIKLLPLSQIVSIEMPLSISRDSTLLILNITNKENIDLSTMLFTFDSDFSTVKENITLGPKSTLPVVLQLDTVKLKTAKAGNYKVKMNFLINAYNYDTEKSIQLEEYANIVTDEKTKFSFFGFTKIITKKNEGNAPKLVTVEITKSKFEHGFTSPNIEPSSKKVNGKVLMIWQREIGPGESFTIAVKTDYTIPVVILIVIIIFVVSTYLIRRPRVIIKKKAYKIKAKGGEFAVKMLLLVKNVGHEIKDVKCVDRLPHMATLYERFGAAKPDKIEKERLEWNFGELVPGEERVVSYIIYSKVTPVGTIQFPCATLSYTDIKEKRQVRYSSKLFVEAEK